MNINEYIDWNELWNNEICLDGENYNLNSESLRNLNDFNKDNADLNSDESCIDGDNLIICFSENGGQNENDNVGWYRSYTFVIDKDFMIIDVSYEQG